MEETRKFDGGHSRVGKFNIQGKTVLLPDMSPRGSQLMAAGFRAGDVPALVMESYHDDALSLGREHTSGKECYPCLITLGDVMHYLRQEQARLGSSFSPSQYVYFMPESEGPCRFGMYNKMQRLVLDHFPEFQDIKIAAITAGDSYRVEGLVPEEKAGAFRRLAINAVIAGDVLDRMVRRVRPYESRQGETDSITAEAVTEAARIIENGGLTPNYSPLYTLLADTAETLRGIMDDRQPRRPRIGIVGEIFVRSHPGSNQELIRQLERFGGEVVNSSIAEWVSFVSYQKGREQRRHALRAWRRRELADTFSNLRRWAATSIEYQYICRRQHRFYRDVLKKLDIQHDHSVRGAEHRLDNDRYFSFDVGTESALSIGGSLELIHEGFNGIVNVFPFTCMPGAIASSILGPLLNDMKVPYMEAPYDGTSQPNREVAIRTFLHQARQHRDSSGNGHSPHGSKKVS